MRKILVIHIGGMGDFIMFTPALNLLKSSFPEADLDILITNKNIRQFIEEQNVFKNILVSSLNLKELVKTGFSLRKKYDLSFFTVGGKVWKTKVFSTILSSRFMIGESQSKLFRFPFNKIIKRDDTRHFVDRNIELVELITNNKIEKEIKPSIKVKKSSEIKANEFLEKYNLKNKIIWGVHPGCQKAYAARRWPEEYFAVVVNEIKKDLNSECLVFLGPEDYEVGEYLKKNTKAIFIENSSINDVIALISKCRYFFNSDSGLGHIFTCFGSKIFSIFGPNQIKENQELRTGPYSKERIILKIEGKNKEYYLEKTDRGIFKCLVDLKPEYVIEKIKENIK